MRPEALRARVATDGHAPGMYRALTVRNLDAWYKAFDVKEGDKLYLAPDKRVRVWGEDKLVIASEAKQSRAVYTCSGLPRRFAPRNDANHWKPVASPVSCESNGCRRRRS